MILPNGASLRPMLFNSEMALKNVAGEKTETRRIVKFESSCYDVLPKNVHMAKQAIGFGKGNLLPKIISNMVFMVINQTGQ